jgi:phage tail sheath protein FI
MPEYLAPGVYVEEIPTGPRSIDGVSTSTAGFVGETERGPTRPLLVTSWADYDRCLGGFLDVPSLNRDNWYLPYAVRGFFENGGRRLYVARVIGEAAAASSVELAGNPGPTTLVANGKGSWGNNVVVLVKKASAAAVADAVSPVVQWFRIQLLYYRDGVPSPFVDPTDAAELANPNRREPDAFEDFDDLSPVATEANFAPAVINGASWLIEMSDCQGTPDLVPFPGVSLANGTYVPAARDDFLRGLAGLGTIQEVSLVSIPDEIAIPQLGTDLLDHCDAMRDRFAILVVQTDSGDLDQVHPLRDSSYGAIYYPRVRVPAPHLPDGDVLVPPHGHLAGIYARVDLQRGVHKAPANEIVLGIVTSDMSGSREPLSHTLSKAEHDILNPRGVNVIRDFRSNNRDIRVWGARTMSSDSTWKYVNVRRLFIFLEQSIGRGTQWAVFEPNSEPTWLAIRQSVTNFLRTVWRNGALTGATQDEAFFVRCDRSSMTQDDLDNGRLICLIGVAPVRPAEFVIFRILQKTTGAG